MSLSFKGDFIASFSARSPFSVPRTVDGFSPPRWNAPYASDLSLAPRYILSPARVNGMNRLSPLLRDIASESGHDFQLGNWTGNVSKEEVSALDATLEWRIRVEYYEPNFVQVHLSYSGSQLSKKIGKDFETHSELLRFLDAKPLTKLMEAIASLALAVPPSQVDGLGKIRRTVSLTLGGSGAELARYLHEQRQQVVAMHIARDALLVVDPRLTSSILDSNAGLNLKSEDRRLLVNAQGVSSVSPRAQGGRPAPTAGTLYNRFGRASALLSIADLFQHMLLRAEGPRELRAASWGGSREVLKRWVTYPTSVLHASRSNLEIWRVLSEQLSLSSLLHEVEAKLK